MIELDAGQSTVINSSVRGAALLIDLDFSTGMQYVTTYSVDIPAMGHNYLALGHVLSVAPLRESEMLSMEKLVLKLSIVNNAMLAATIGPASVYRNRPVRIYMQLIGANWEPVESPELRWSGFMDKVEIERKANKEGNSSGSINLTCQRSGLARFRNASGLRMSHRQQQLDYPGDMGLEYTDSLVKSPPVWLTKAFQEQ